MCFVVDIEVVEIDFDKEKRRNTPSEVRTHDRSLKRRLHYRCATEIFVALQPLYKTNYLIIEEK